MLFDPRVWLTTYILSVLTGCLGVAATGCQGSGKDGGVTTQDAQKFLADGKFKGNGKWHQSGAPLSVGQKTVFWIGPEAATFEFDGFFDFTEPNASTMPAGAK